MKIALISLYNQLHSAYGPQGWWPIKGRYNQTNKHTSKSSKQKFEIAIGAILTQNTSWTNVEKALAQLKKKKLLSKKAIIKSSHKLLAKTIKSSGYHNQKARKLKEFVNQTKNITTQPTRDQLLSIWGVGPETADSILLYAYDHPTFVIDTYTKRLLSRLGIVNKEPKDINYHELQETFHKELPKDHKIFNEFHALIVEHAKQYCQAKPKCANCPLSSQCNYAKENLL